MFTEIALDVAKLILIVVVLVLALRVYVRARQPRWSATLARRQLAIIVILTFATLAVKLIEDVVSGESRSIDRTLLIDVHDGVPEGFRRTFEVITNSASAKSLFPLSVVLATALLMAGRRQDAVLLGSSVCVAVTLVYVAKTLVDRQRPALWETATYWGTSFPSGHTLTAAAFATALVVIVRRNWPRAQWPAVLLATVWVSLVATSRLVLGVHWPTDVLAAACMGISVSLALSVALELRGAGQGG